MNPYESFVTEFARLVERARGYPLGGFPSPMLAPADPRAPRALIFSPHPDDEVIVGALPLRLRRELRWNIVNVAVTQGSNQARRVERWQELRACCAQVGFELVAAAPHGFDDVNPAARAADPAGWKQRVQRLTELLLEHEPRAIFFPHDDDWNVTHIGTHYLVADALAGCPAGFSCLTIETEFWGAMRAPNLLVESSERDIADLIAALSFHAGEVKRNPYHLRFPAWLMDNVRRGGELVGGQGSAAPDFLFGTLYRLRRWRAGEFVTVLKMGRLLSQADDLGPIFAP